MKPEELDDLFRRGLSEQHAPPRPNAWAAIQQRMNASADAAAGDDDDLPAFLRNGAPTTAAPAPAPFMTAARGGAALRQPTASLTAISWWQRPAVRVAAAVLLLVGGGTVAIQHVEPLHSSPSVAVLAPTSLAPAALAPAALAPAATTEQAVASTETASVGAPATAPSESVKAVEAQSTSGVEAVAQVASAPAASTTEQHTARVQKAFRQAATPTALASNLRVTDALIHDHLLCEVQHCRACDVIEEKIGSTRFRSLRADATAELVARNNTVRRNEATRTADLLTDAVVEVTIRPAADPNAAAPAAAFVSNRAMAEADETVEIGGGTVGQLVSKAAGRRQFRVPSANTLIRRASGRVLEILDRADHTADGQLTIETNLAGREVMKTISL